MIFWEDSKTVFKTFLAQWGSILEGEATDAPNDFWELSKTLFKNFLAQLGPILEGDIQCPSPPQKVVEN